MSRLIMDSIFLKGYLSRFAHLYVAPLHFPHKDHVETYKVPFLYDSTNSSTIECFDFSCLLFQDQLRQWIRGNVSLCERSLFVFDEMDKMPVGLLDAIKPFLEHYPEINGVDYRKSIFIFLRWVIIFF